MSLPETVHMLQGQNADDRGRVNHGGTEWVSAGMPGKRGLKVVLDSRCCTSPVPSLAACMATPSLRRRSSVKACLWGASVCRLLPQLQAESEGLRLHFHV